jgi:N-acetyl-anhydromuramyl-L-alanine amidase AmpD
MIQKRDIDKIDKIIVHCSASDIKAHDDISVIRNWHKQRGFVDVGYHFFIKRNGKIQVGRKLYEVGAHCQGHNTASIGICLSGNKIFTFDQFRAAAILYHDLIDIIPTIGMYSIYPHYMFNDKKTCPNFNVKEITRITDEQMAGLKLDRVIYFDL